GEIVVADNGSTDGSQDIALAHGARVIDVPVRGYGAALQAGIAAARGEFVVMGDADDSYALEDIAPFIDELRAGADLVMGNRFKGGIAPGAMPWLHKYLGNPVLSYLGRLFFKIPVGDFHCGLRAFRRPRILELGLRTQGMEFASEMVVRSALNRLTMREVPTTLRPDGRSRSPHLRTWSDGWRHLKFLLALSPRWMFYYPGLALLLIGLVGMLSLAFGPISVGTVTFDLQTFIAATAVFLAGSQAIGLALVARAYGSALGLLPESRRITGWLQRLGIEHGLAWGMVLVGLGFAAFVVALVRWGDLGFGDLAAAQARLPVVGLACVVVGAQVISTSFAMSMANFRETANGVVRGQELFKGTS
ncbi:MAG: glycosyltransferase family 2 protein, partial [Propionibacterium sp.]|nr:glycosyltransferase family 2 protein [Propionibacterium sp.]